MNLNEFIHYYRKCPLCHHWMTLDADLSIPCALEIKEDHLGRNEYLQFLIYEDKQSPKEYKLYLETNKVISDFPFIFNSPNNQIRRVFLNKTYDPLKIEARCYSCSNFRYYSNNMEFNPITHTLENVGVYGERVKLKDKDIEFIIINNYKLNTTTISVNSDTEFETKQPIPFMAFKSLDFSKPKKIIRKIKHTLLLS